MLEFFVNNKLSKIRNQITIITDNQGSQTNPDTIKIYSNSQQSWKLSDKLEKFYKSGILKSL
jgi:hypothetical protein